MRLALLTDRPHSNYGAELNLLAVGALAREMGHDVVAVSIEPGVFVDSAVDRGLAAMVVPTPEGLTEIWAGGLRPTPTTLVRMARFGATLHRQLRGEAVDVVMTSSVRAGAMMWPGRLQRPHLLWYVQMLTEPSPATAAAGLVANRIAIIAPGVERAIPHAIRRARRGRIHHLPPWRDVTAFAADARPPHPSGSLDVVTVGKVTPRKGIHILVEAVAIACDAGTDVSLTVVGAPSGRADEQYAAETRALAERRGVAVTWSGWQDDVAPFLLTADAFALVSEREGLPGAVVEAMAAGLPIVVSDTGPVADLVQVSGSGLVAPAGDIRAVAAHLISLADDPATARDMGLKGTKAATAFSPDETKSAIDAILNAMAPRRARPHRGAARS